jgi:hypothetical protein
MTKLSMMSFLFALTVLFGQTAVPPAFEVASIKQTLPLSIENILGSFGMVPDTSGAAIFRAVKDLGLELKSRKAPVETIIVDHVEKTPGAN